jgi:PilZ domain
MDTLYKERKYRRFNLTFPVHVKARSGGIVSEINAISGNLSVGGVLLETETIIPKDSDVSFVVAVRDIRIAHPTALVGEGKVVRIERISDAAFRIAVECTNPMTHEKFFSPLSSQG